MKILLILATLYSSASFAVVTKLCPERMTLTYETLEPASYSQIAKDAKGRGRDPQDGVISRDNFAKARFYEFQEVTVALYSKGNSQCAYVQEGEDANGDNETRLITRDGKDFLRVSLRINGENYWTYHSVVRYGLDGIEIKPARAFAFRGVFDHGGPVYLVGWGTDVAIEVK